MPIADIVFSLIKWFRLVTFPVKVRLLRWACGRLANKTEMPTRTDIVLIALAWGNFGYAAGLSYLRTVADKARQSEGPILECGSGTTTLLIAALTKQRNTRVIVLEHDRDWFDYLSRTLTFLRFDHVELVCSPLVDYGRFCWYQPPTEVSVSGIQLIICDGPPGRTLGGRYGLLPVMGTYFASDCVVLLDDVSRASEREVIDRWRHDRALSARHQGRFGRHAEVVLH